LLFLQLIPVFLSVFILENVFKADFFNQEIVAGVETLLQELSTQCKTRQMDDDQKKNFNSVSFQFDSLGDFSFFKQQAIISVPEKLLITINKNSSNKNLEDLDFYVPLLKYYLTICDESFQETVDSFFVLCMILLMKMPIAREFVLFGPFQMANFQQVKSTGLTTGQNVLDTVAEILQMLYDLNFNRIISKELTLRVHSLAYNEDFYQSVLVTRAIGLRTGEFEKFHIK